MLNNTNNHRSKPGDTRRIELAVVTALLVAVIAATVVMADSSKWDSSPTAIGTTVQW